MIRELFTKKIALKNILKGSGFIVFSTTLFGLLLVTAMMNAWYASLSLVTPLEQVIKQTLRSSC